MGVCEVVWTRLGLCMLEGIGISGFEVSDQLTYILPLLSSYSISVIPPLSIHLQVNWYSPENMTVLHFIYVGVWVEEIQHSTEVSWANIVVGIWKSLFSYPNPWERITFITLIFLSPTAWAFKLKMIRVRRAPFNISLRAICNWLYATRSLNTLYLFKKLNSAKPDGSQKHDIWP